MTSFLVGGSTIGLLVYILLDSSYLTARLQAEKEILGLKQWCSELKARDAEQTSHAELLEVRNELLNELLIELRDEADETKVECEVLKHERDAARKIVDKYDLMGERFEMTRQRLQEAIASKRPNWKKVAEQCLEL
jgi:hypothetical protein